MSNPILLLPIIIPFIAGLFVLVLPKKWGGTREAVTLIITFFNFLLAVFLFKFDFSSSWPWTGFGAYFSLRLYHFSGFIVLAAAFFGFLIALYSVVFMHAKKSLNQFYAYLLLTLAFTNGAVLADNLLLLFFFWEGLLLMIFGLIAIGHPNAFKSATKAFIIVGVSDLCMMIGIALTGYLAHTMTISKINLPLDTLGGWAFIFLTIGALAKAGSMPFHSWIPDAATDAPLPFMALFPAALEKLLGIYFLARISLDIFKLSPHAWANTLLMIVGSITIILAVMMALVQKDYKRLLSYHAISQVGYMVLGIGTALPVGIIGGLFHMLNNALYKTGLFMTGGSVEKQTGTTDLSKLGGLRTRMPITFICFFITACSISGVPPFNGFFSKELIYDAALQRGSIFYLAALLGTFLTAASFLKLGHAAFFGKPGQEHARIKEVPWPMLLPMILIALACIIFGVRSDLAVGQFFEPVLGLGQVKGHHVFGMSSNTILVFMTVFVLAGALLNHLWGAKRAGSGLRAVDHIYHAPVLSDIYAKAEERYFDPYDIGLKVTGAVAKISWWVDRKIDWVYDNGVVGMTTALAKGVRRVHSGNYSVYILWSLIAMVLVLLALLK